MKNFFSKNKLRLLIATLGLYAVVSYSFVDNYFEVSKNLDIFATLFRELNMYYVDETNPGDLMKKGIDDMLESLDPYTNYIPESDIEDYRYMTTGQYGGIGALIRQKDNKVFVAEPYEGYPAQKGGLQAGDAIIEVNGVATKGKKTDEVSKLLKGSPNTPVRIIVERDGEKKPLEKNIIREEIKVKNVTYYGMINSNTGYIKLSGFTEDAANEVKNAFLELKKDPNFKQLVFDLRGNPGGLLKEAVEIVNLFVDKGQEIVSTKGKIKEWDKTHRATNAPIDTQTPMTVLVNRGSASAAEIVSGALQDLDRAVIVGQRSFGKGLVQQTRPLSYNSQLKVTVAKYYIPSGRCIQALDYSHKNEDGSVEKVPDSLITAFKTVKNGRTVYDGAGIAPDIAIEPEKYANISISLMNKSHVFDYATKYKIAHATIPPAMEFKLSDDEYNDFVKFLDGKEYDYTTKAEKQLEELKKIAEEEKTFDIAKAEYETLKTKLTHNKKEDLIKYKAEIKELLEEEIASRYYYQKGRLQASLNGDKEVAEALTALNDNKKYNSILTTVVKATRPFHSDKVKDK